MAWIIRVSILLMKCGAELARNVDDLRREQQKQNDCLEM